MRTRIVALLLTTAFLCQLNSFAPAGAHSNLYIGSATSGLAHIPAPEDVLGFVPGDDRKLASWDQVLNYFQALAKASDRIKFETLGKSTMDAPFVMATISAPENLERLEEYKRTQELLADPRKLGPPSVRGRKARELIARGKTIVLITCGIHSTEVGSYLSSMLIAHRLASSNQPEIQSILRNTIILLVPSLNPDGVDIVKNWYDKTLGTPYEGTGPPELYNKYVGHDNNRDWYAFTQVETQIAVDKIHNVWHPQIVHDIHQQDIYGSRLFLPPYMRPVEPNVPKQIVEGYTELGSFMAREMRARGFKGITTNSTYDAWSPARAYSHYHAGVRILSETASARIASPITIKFGELKKGEGYDPKKVSANFGPLWNGGEWHLRDITNYMTTAAFLLLRHASEHREQWLRRFYEIGKEAVRTRRATELSAFTVSLHGDDLRSLSTFAEIMRQPGPTRVPEHYDRRATGHLLGTLLNAGIEMYAVASVRKDQSGVEAGDYFIPLSQPYGSFAKALLERQTYPDLRDKDGVPASPYDATAHTLPLLMGVEVRKYQGMAFSKQQLYPAKAPIRVHLSAFSALNFGTASPAIYKSHVPAMDEGWSRWVVVQYALTKPGYSSLDDREIRKGHLSDKYRAIVIPDQPPKDILNGHRPGAMPPEYTGGLGPEGVKALREFVELGGTLVCLNRASSFAIEQFKLPVRDVVADVPEKDFFVPGSILRIELDTSHPLARGMPAETIAWVEDSPVFEIKSDPRELARVRIIARYPADKNPLLSGWLLGANRLKGKAALVEVGLGKGRIILFGFRPQYRGQSLATYPLFFNAIRNK
jgi:hypothetical protein